MQSTVIITARKINIKDQVNLNYIKKGGGTTIKDDLVGKTGTCTCPCAPASNERFVTKSAISRQGVQH